jgi:DNA-directed RNA polymerase specialized sigma24 family protein
VSRDETLAAFVVHVQTLSDEDRRMLMYRGLEGLPHDEVARLMGLSTDVAAKRWQRLRDRLRDEVASIDFVAA